MTKDTEPDCLKELQKFLSTLDRNSTRKRCHSEEIHDRLCECLGKIQKLCELGESTRESCSMHEDAVMTDMKKTIFPSEDNIHQKAKEIENSWNSLHRALLISSDRPSLFPSESTDEVLETLRLLGSPEACIEDMLNQHPHALPRFTSAIEKIKLVQERLKNDLDTYTTRANALRSKEAYITKQEYLTLLETRKLLMLKSEYNDKLREMYVRHLEWQDAQLPFRKDAVERYIQSCTFLAEEYENLAKNSTIDPKVKYFSRILKQRTSRLRKAVKNNIVRLERTKRELYKREKVGEFVGKYPYLHRNTEERFHDLWCEYDEDVSKLYELEQTRIALKHELETVELDIKQEYDKRIDLLTAFEDRLFAVEIVTNVDISPRA